MVRVSRSVADDRHAFAEADFCDPFGFCQGSQNQFELTGGFVLRF
jgi:hypothetical protein